jgi:hypothetical protein
MSCAHLNKVTSDFEVFAEGEWQVSSVFVVCADCNKVLTMTPGYSGFQSHEMERRSTPWVPVLPDA